eukprot:918047_1
MAELRIWGNLTNGEDRELTPRTDIVLTETDDTIILLQSDERLVTGQAVGTSDVTATLAGRQVSAERDNYTSNLVDFAVADHLINLDTIELYTFIDRDHVFEDLINTRELLKLDATFSDGVIIPDILRKMVDDDLWPTTAISEVFTFTSTDPEVVSVDEDGFVEILDNWWRGVNITVQSQCSDAEAAELIYPNLKPDYWDVDVEEPYTETGLQFENQDHGATGDPFEWNVYINATTGTLLSFSIRLWWDDNLFIENGTDECSYYWEGRNFNNPRDAWPQCEAAGDWEGQMVSWNIDTVRGELRLAGASSTGSSTNNSLQHVATCNMRVRQTESNISMVVGHVIEISYLDAADNTIKHVYNQPIVAGDGYQQINDGQTIKPIFPDNVQQRYEKEQSLTYDCSASTGDECLFEGDSCSCCTEPVFGDANFDCKHTAFDAQAITYYFIDTTSAYPDGFSTIPLGDVQHSQRIAMDQSLDYLQDDRNECAYASLDNPCPQGLEDTWYALQVSTGKFLYLNLSRRNQSLVQNARVVKGIAPMFIQEYPNIFRYATDLDATVFFELRGINEANVPGFTGTDALAIGEVIPWSSQPGVLGTHTINDSIIIKGEYINNTYWTFETTEFDWEDGDCFEMAILYETYSEDDGIIHTYDASEYVEPTKDPDNPVNCTQIDREYAFRGSEYYGDVFLEFTELCLVETTNPPTHNPTPAPTSSPTVEWTGPEIVDCRYEDHGTAILAFFNMDTNRAGFEGSPFSCLATWNPVSFNDIEGVTEDSRCIWKDFSTMRIELGYEFGMRPTYADQSYRLILAGGNVRNYAEDSPPATGYCIVYPMFNPPPVFASIIGPTHLGPCDDLRLLGSPTTGQAAPMTWEWQLPDRSLQNGCVLGSAAIPNDKEILYIPNNCLTSSESEEEYVFVLTATNHYLVNFNYDASQSKTERAIVMYPTASKKPTVELLVPTVVNITTEQDLIVPAFVRADSGGSCDEDDLVFDIDQFSFEWETLEYFTDILGQDGYNPFGSLWSDERDPNDGQNHINFDNFVLIPLTDDLASTKSSSTLIVPGSNFEAGKYYGFKLTVTYKGSGQTNVAYVGVVVNLPIPYPRPSQMYQSIRQGKDITVDVNNLYDFYDQVNVASLYGIEWDCVDEELNSVLSDASSFDGLESITINELNADLSVGNVYNCSAHLFSTQRNTLDMTWGRQESYYVFEYVIDDSDWLINNNGSFKMISVELTTNIGTINRNKRVVISATITDDSWRPDDRPAGYDWDNGYTFSWSNFGENSNMQDDVYGISIIEHLEYEHNTGTINFVVDDEVNRFIFDGQKYGFQLKVTADELAGGQVYGGYGQIELIANRGPNGGQCVVELFSAASMIYRVECYGWTDEYMELPLEYNFMLLNFCWNDNVCPGQLICDKTSEYDMGVCTLTTVGPVQNYLREWTQGTVHYFTLRHTKWGGKKFILRTFVRDYTGFVTTFDTAFKVAEDDSFTNRDDMFNPMFAQMQASQEVRGTTAFGQYITAVDTLLDRWPGNNRTDIQREIDELYYSNFNNGNNRLFDRFYDYQKIYSSFLNEIMFDYTQFNDPRLKEITKESPSMNVAMRSMKMIRDMIRYYDTKRGGLEEKMIPRDLSVYELLSMTWPGDAALQQEDLNTMTVKWNNLKKWYFNWVLMINEQGLNERLVDETHYNVSYDGLLVLSGWETNSKLFSDDSDCGGDLVDLAPDYYVSYFGGERVDYVKCELVSFNGGILTPTAVSEYMSSPIIYWKLRGFLKDGTEIPAGGSGRRRMVEFGACSPFLYQVPHNPDTGLMNYGDRMDTTSKQSFIPWSVCKTVLELSNDTEANPALSSADSQAPTAKDCYVLTHDEQKTVCACNSNYTLLSVEEELYYPKFMATLNRYNPDWSWDGLMHSVGAMLWILILLFFFTFAFYVLPSYDKHKALLAVKKGLPKSQREGAYFQTAEGKVFRAARINMNNMSWCQVYGEVYKIRLRNDHLCLWWCCDDPGSNVSHFIKVLLSVLYCLLFLFQLAWFYGKEHETAFPDTLFAFLIAFETILPIWCCAWCISKIRPHEFTDEEIDELVNDQMPIITKDQKWEDEYESDVEHGGAEEMDEGDEAGGFFAIPEIHESPPERQNNWDILRVYTDIDEEMEFLEENYMPDENKWHKKKRKTYPLEKVGYEPMESDEESLSSLESHEERRGFEGQNLPSHYGQARDAAKLGFIPVNEEEEYDPIASAMLNENRKEQLKQKRKDRHEREGSISSKLSSLFRRDASEDSKGQKKKKKKEKKPRNNKEEHEYRLVSPQVWDALDELDRVYKYKPSYPEPNDVNLISWFSFWKTCHSRQQFGRNLFDAICLTRVQSVVSMLAHQIAEYTQYVAANPIIIALSNQELCYENASSRSRCHELFDHSAANMKRMDSKGNMENIFIFKFKEKVVDSDHYHTFIQRFTLRNSNAILIFTRPNCSNIYIAYNGLISLLSLALNFEDLQYFLPHFVLLSKGLSVNVDTPRLNVCDFGTVIDYALDDGGIIYNVRCTGNVHYRLNYYELFDQTPPHIYHSSKRKSLLSPLAITNLWKNKKKNGLDPSSGHVHPFHSVCLSVMESVTQCVSIMQECKSTVIEDQLQESGFILLFYRTLINNSSKEKAEKLSNLIDQLKQKGCLAKIIKYEAPIPLTYHDLCDRFASILDRDGINNHQVLVCHLIEHQVEELVPVSTHGDGAYGDDDEDTTFIPTELHSDSDYEANQGKLKSTFECLITHECEMIPRLQSVEDLCSDYKLLTLFDACGVYSRQDLEDKSLINKLQTRSMKDEELSKTFAVFMKELNSNESHQRKRDCVQIKVGLSRNAKCLLQDIEEYNDNTLIIGYNPLQTVVVSSTSFQSVTHPIHLYRAALDHHFYPQEMTSLLWPEWMSISTDGESVITAFAALIESDTTHDVILVPSSIALRQPFLTKHCQMIAPLCGAIGEWEVLLLYKGMIYRMVNENGNQLEVVLRRLYDNIKGTQVENIAFKLLHIGCGICFFQSVNGSTTQVISSHHRSQMDFAIELRNIMFLNDIDCRIPFNTNIVTEKNKCSICHWLQIKPSSIGNDECIHTFCQRCITQWNAIRDECPMCRKKIKKICIDYEKDKQMKENIPMIIYEQILYEQALLCCRSNMISDYQYEREQQKRYEAVDRNEALD